jgi:nucleotide-binding universal stress UspA family protein
MKDHYTQGYVTEGLIPPGQAPVGVPPQPSVENLFETRKQRLINFLEQKIGPALLNRVTIRPYIKLGKVVEEIVATAREERCDLIVMTSQASRIRRLLRGSLTERVVRRAPCPVITIQSSAEIRTEKDERLPVNRIDKWAA